MERAALTLVVAGALAAAGLAQTPARDSPSPRTELTGTISGRVVVGHLVAVRPLYRKQHLGNEGFMALHCQLTFAWPAGSPAVPAGGPKLDWRAEWRTGGVRGNQRGSPPESLSVAAPQLVRPQTAVA